MTEQDSDTLERWVSELTIKQLGLLLRWLIMVYMQRNADHIKARQEHQP